MEPLNNVNDINDPSSSSSLLDTDAKLRAAIDPGVQAKVRFHQDTADFIDGIRTLHIPGIGQPTEADPHPEERVWCSFSPQSQLYLVVVAFMIPSAWSIVSILVDTSTEVNKMFFDGCLNRTNVTDIHHDLGVRIPDFKTCLECADWRSWVLSNETSPHERQGHYNAHLKLAAIVISAVVALIASAAYARLCVMESTGWHLLKYGVVVKTAMSPCQLGSTLLVLVLFLLAAAFSVWTNASVANSLNRIPLHETHYSENGTAGDHGAAACFGNITAWFDSDNPSTPAAAVPKTWIAYAKAILVVFLPMTAVIIKLYNAATQSFSQVFLDQLFDNVNFSSGMFSRVSDGFEVAEDDLDSALEQYATEMPTQPTSCRGAVRRVITLDCACAHPPAQFFSWPGSGFGEREIDVQRVCTILKEKGQLHKYEGKVLATGEGRAVSRSFGVTPKSATPLAADGSSSSPQEHEQPMEQQQQQQQQQQGGGGYGTVV